MDVPLIRVESLHLLEVRDLAAGQLIAAASPKLPFGWVLGQVVSVEPRYAESASKPYGRVTVKAMMGGEETTFFCPYGTMFLVAVEDDIDQPF